MSPQKKRRRDIELAAGPGASEPETATAERDRMFAALRELSTAVVIVDATGREVFRNPPAERYRAARHADAVVAAVTEGMLVQAIAGERAERELRVFGPPSMVVNITVTPLEVDGTVIGASAEVLDVSELHRVESVRRDFVANVSHELKTPIGALEVLAETLASEDDPAVIRPLAERMIKEAERLARIVDDLLDLSLIESQESPLRAAVPGDLLVDEALERLFPVAAAAAIDLRREGRVPGVQVSCDRRQVVGAIANLIDNAIKYSDAGSSVVVSTLCESERLVVAVSDRGIGIPSRDLERVFERFYRVDQARSRDTGGTGLGLAIVRHVAQAHGGEITVESVEGEGSTFRFALPLDTTPGATGLGAGELRATPSYEQEIA